MHHAIALGSVAASGLTIFLLGAELPETVASHFNSAGVPDSFMPRTTFVVLMLVFGCGLPLLTYGLQLLLARSAQVKIPHAEHWFAPDHREGTIRWLCLHAAWGAAGLAVFLAHTFWLTVLAHRQSPVALPATPFWVSLVLFLVATGYWVYLQHRRFRRR